MVLADFSKDNSTVLQFFPFLALYALLGYKVLGVYVVHKFGSFVSVTVVTLSYILVINKNTHFASNRFYLF